MELRDFIVTPIVLIIVYLVAYVLRPMFTDRNTRRYFIPALTVRVVGAIAVGFVYQFYYSGGDTFNYHTHGSRHVWEAFVDNPASGLKLLFAGKENIPELFEYTSKIRFFGDLPSYFVIRIAAFFDLFTFSSYSATAVLFAVMSFSGMWALFQVFYRRFIELHKYLALAIFFVPSVFFWGSGIFKDTITLAALGWGVYAFDQLIFKRNKVFVNTLLLIFSFFIIFSIKKYILLCLIPALIIWLYTANMAAIRSWVLKLLIAPFILILTVGISYWAIVKVGEDDPRYAIDKIAATSQITAYDIRYGWGARNGVGSGYELGELDGSFGSMIQLLPSAINVALFRPYLWEVRNSLMLLSAIESFFILVFTLLVLYKTKLIGWVKSGTKPIVFFCLTFSLVFAFAVGISTYNFGTLMRYKIPLLPFFLTALILILYRIKNNKEEIT